MDNMVFGTVLTAFPFLVMKNFMALSNPRCKLICPCQISNAYIAFCLIKFMPVSLGQVTDFRCSEDILSKHIVYIHHTDYTCL